MSEDNKLDPTLDPVTPEGKTFSADYVKAIREEAKENRLARKAAEAESLALKAKFKAFLGLKDADELDDDKLTAYQAAQEKKLATVLKEANKRLVKSEIKALEGYDPKLVERLLDWSKVQVSETGEVTGLKELVEELVKEFPQVKLAASTGGGVNPAPGDPTQLATLERDYDKAVKEGRTAEAISLKNEIWRKKNTK